MSYRAWMNARRLLFEERFGIHVRAAERKERQAADELSERGRATRAYLKQQQLEKLE